MRKTGGPIRTIASGSLLKLEEREMRSDKIDAMPRRLSGSIAKMGRGPPGVFGPVARSSFCRGNSAPRGSAPDRHWPTQGTGPNTILDLVLAYLALAPTEGGIKLVLNVYRRWIGEVAIRWLRMVVIEQGRTTPRIRRPWPKASKCRLCLPKPNGSVDMWEPAFQNLS